MPELVGGQRSFDVEVGFVKNLMTCGCATSRPAGDLSLCHLREVGFSNRFFWRSVIYKVRYDLEPLAPIPLRFHLGLR
jgi:hypothetical protein